MYESDLELLCCPKTHENLVIHNITRTDDDGEILEAELRSSSHTYPITNGIPRFVESVSDNKSWNYKWKQIDAGRGLNYRIIDKQDPAYALHDLFDKNAHGQFAHSQARNGIALDIGCGVGQYSYRLITEFEPRKMISMDLTEGTDIFRQIMLQRFPELKPRLLIVQASVFQMPFREQSIDYVMSLGVLMHTGNTLGAIRNAAKLVKPNGYLNIWVYASVPVAYDLREPGRHTGTSLTGFIPLQIRWLIVNFWIRLFRLSGHGLALKFMKFFASDAFYRFCCIPGLGKLVEFLFPRVRHPDADYRFINIYDWFYNNWGDTWNEHEIFPVLRENGIAVLDMSEWRLGFLGRKLPGFYTPTR